MTDRNVSHFRLSRVLVSKRHRSALQMRWGDGMRTNTKTAPLLRRFVKAAVVVTAVGLCSATCALAKDALQATYNLDIPAQSLRDALQALALASKHRLVYSSGVVDGK